MEFKDIMIQTSGVLFFASEADDDGDHYTLKTKNTVLIVQQTAPGGTVGLSMIKATDMIGKPTMIRVFKNGLCVQDVTDTEFLANAYSCLTGVIRATTDQAKRVIAQAGR